jgi:hypothetical protein
MTDTPDSPSSEPNNEGDINDKNMPPAAAFAHTLETLNKIDPELVVGLCLIVGVANTSQPGASNASNNGSINVTEFYIGDQAIISSLHMAQYKTLQRMINNAVNSQMMHFIDKDPSCSSTSL